MQKAFRGVPNIKNKLTFFPRGFKYITSFSQNFTKSKRGGITFLFRWFGPNSKQAPQPLIKRLAKLEQQRSRQSLFSCLFPWLFSCLFTRLFSCSFTWVFYCLLSCVFSRLILVLLSCVFSRARSRAWCGRYPESALAGTLLRYVGRGASCCPHSKLNINRHPNFRQPARPRALASDSVAAIGGHLRCGRRGSTTVAPTVASRRLGMAAAPSLGHLRAADARDGSPGSDRTVAANSDVLHDEHTPVIPHDEDHVRDAHMSDDPSVTGPSDCRSSPWGSPASTSSSLMQPPPMRRPSPSTSSPPRVARRAVRP